MPSAAAPYLQVCLDACKHVLAVADGAQLQQVLQQLTVGGYVKHTGGAWGKGQGARNRATDETQTQLLLLP